MHDQIKNEIVVLAKIHYSNDWAYCYLTENTMLATGLNNWPTSNYPDLRAATHHRVNKMHYFPHANLPVLHVAIF